MPNIQTLIQFLFSGDYVGFIQAIYVSAFQSADLFYGTILMGFSMLAYIRVKSIIYMSILWILVGSLVAVATPLLMGFAMFFMVMGIGTFLFKLFVAYRS